MNIGNTLIDLGASVNIMSNLTLQEIGLCFDGDNYEEQNI